jgi:AraC family ethanolamine operon transcriptional activator
LETVIPVTRLPTAGRHRRMRQIHEYLRSHTDRPLYAEELAARFGISPRALEKEFQDFLGLSPMMYLRRMRLHGVRRTLKKAPPVPGIVKQTALAWGFWHQGHFARDYRSFFGEPPSATVRAKSHA